MQCPKCDSQYVVKNGHTHTGKHNFKCRDWGRQFVMNSRHQPISKSTRELIDRLLRIENIFGGNRKSYRSFGTVAPVLCQSKIRSSQKRSASNLKKKRQINNLM